jgi:hypothetical protein
LLTAKAAYFARRNKVHRSMVFKRWTRPVQAIAGHCATVLFVVMAARAGDAHAQPAPYCLPGQVPSFEPGLSELNDQIGGLLGEPLECLHPDLGSGDSIQVTSTGLAVIQARTNLPGFVSGEEHWQLTPDGVVYWTEPAAAPAPPPAAPPSGIAPPAIVDVVVADAAARLQVDPSEVQVMRWERVAWPDSSLGCPQPGGVYLQVITPGWLVMVEAAGQTLEYHTDEAGHLAVCGMLRPRVPPIDGT